jgi:hypothetical protein
MQKAIVPAALLTAAFQKEQTTARQSYEVKAVQKNAQAAASHLYGLFFGNKNLVADVPAPDESKTGEPDYFCSYE